MGTWPSADVTRWMVDQMVVSVGPYMFHSSAQRGSSASARSGGSASPPHSTFNCGDPLHPAAISAPPPPARPLNRAPPPPPPRNQPPPQRRRRLHHAARRVAHPLHQARGVERN